MAAPGTVERLDSHIHLWRYDKAQYSWMSAKMGALQRDFTAEDLAGELAASGYAGAIAVQARQTLEETQALLAIANAHPSVVRGVVGWLDLRLPLPDLRRQLDACLGGIGGARLVGARHVIHDEEDDAFCVQPAFVAGVDLLAEYKLTYDLLLFPRHCAPAVALVRACPRTRFVVDHIAKPGVEPSAEWLAGIRALAAFPNVHCKLSGLVTEAAWDAWAPEQFTASLDVVLDAFSPARCMIGSDWPVCTLAAPHARAMAVVEDYLQKRYSAEEVAAVLGGNAARFYNLAA